jgi:DNA invertase Pin-like site-specific DNA recombinase
MSYGNVPLVPKDPNGPLRVMILGRISTPHQDLENINASYGFAERYLKQIYQGPLHVKHLGERGSGMRTDRASILEAEEEIENGTWDLVLCEDLSRPYRNPRHQMAFVQNAVDAGVRVVCIGDNLDTADENWEVALQAAALRHGLYIPDTRRRVKRTAHHAFHRGGMVQKVRYGYRKLSKEEADSGAFGPRNLRIAKVPECTPWIREMKGRVLAGASYESVARWLEDEGIDPGPYVTSGRWTGRLVKGLLGDPILHGERTFGDGLSQTLYRTGKKKRQKNPNPPEVEHHPELAHLTEEEHAELLRVMARSESDHRHAVGADHPRYNKPRAQALWPAQHPRCAVCGERLYRYNEDELKCQGRLRAPAEGGEGFVEGPCWNHLQVDCGAIRERVLGWVLDVCGKVPAYRGALADAAWSELRSQQARRDRSHRTVDEEIAGLEKRGANLARAIAQGGQLESLMVELAGVEEALKGARRRRAEAASVDPSRPTVESRADVDAHLEWAVRELASGSYEFAALMRRVLPVFRIVPVQALDSGLVRPRARLVLRLSALGDDVGSIAEEAPRPGDVATTLDLFEPALPIRAMAECVAAKASGPKMSLDKIAAATGYNRMTVKRALAYARLMAAAGSSDPYRELTECPERASRWRHRDAS